jgi:hypothetical protein
MCTDFRGNPSLPRGIRNNNPGNLRTGDSWQGMVGSDPQSFIIFANVCWGIRALGTDLTSKINRGLDTIAKIFPVYAPATDNNNVSAYINAVSNSTGLGADEQLGTDPQTLADLIRAIADHENGNSSMITDQDISDGIGMMGISAGTLIQAAQAAAENTDPTTNILILAGVAILIYVATRRE